MDKCFLVCTDWLVQEAQELPLHYQTRSKSPNPNQLLSIILTIYSFIFSLNFFVISDCDNYLKKSLFFVGEIGGNDYNYHAFVGENVVQLKASVPLVVEAITKAISVSNYLQTDYMKLQEFLLIILMFLFLGKLDRC